MIILMANYIFQAAGEKFLSGQSSESKNGNIRLI